MIKKEEAIRILYVYSAVYLVDASHREAFDIAIKALEQEPCEDAISREEAIDACNQSVNILEATDRIKDLPPVCQEPKWIPVSERFPEVGEKVLCQCQANIYEVLKLTVDGWYYDKNHCYMLSFVTAWMPLPEPYKAESEV